MSDVAFAFLKEELIPSDLRMPFRKKAFDAFRNLGYPTRKTEVFKYIPLQVLYSHQFESALYNNLDKQEIEKYISDSCKDSYLTLINGQFYPSLSSWESSEVLVNSLDGAMSDYAIFLQNRFQSNLKQETNPFAFLNASFHGDGIFIYLPKDTKAKKPLQILNLTHNFEGAPSATFPRVHAFIGQNASLSIVHTTHHIGEGYHLCMPYIDCVLEQNGLLQLNDTLVIPDDNWYLADYRFSLKNSSKVTCVDFSKGSKTVRRDYKISLTEEKAEADLKGLHFLKRENNSHTNVLIEHLAPNCKSSQLFKYVIDDEAKASFDGKIYVSPAAQQTEAYQLNKNLILSDFASAFSKPNLEIFADDVKASHGATFGRISESEMFYLRSRGISEEKAKKIMINAFCSEISESFYSPLPNELLC